VLVERHLAVPDTLEHLDGTPKRLCSRSIAHLAHVVAVGFFFGPSNGSALGQMANKKEKMRARGQSILLCCQSLLQQ